MIQFGSPVIVPNAFYQNYFVEDAWRVKPNLMLTLGLRYENYGTPFNAIPFRRLLVSISRLTPSHANSAITITLHRVSVLRTRLISANLCLVITKRLFVAASLSTTTFFFNNILANTAATVPNSFGVTNFGASLPADTDPRGIAKFGVGSLPTTGTPDPFATINTIPT